MKKLSLLLGVALLTLTSCSKNDSSNASVLVKTIDSETVTYNGNHIVSIVGSNSTTNYTYTGNLITSVSGTYPLVDADGNATYKEDYTYDSNSRLISEVYSYAARTAALSIDSKIEYTYNSDGTVTAQDFDYYNGTYTASKITKYTFANGNIVRQENLNHDGTSDFYGHLTVFEFDSKNNPFYNITGFAKLFNSNKNNITKSTHTYHNNGVNTEVTTYVYTYNAKGYPISIVATKVFDSGSPQVSKTTYTY